MDIILVLNPQQFIHGISLKVSLILFQVYSLSNYSILISFSLSFCIVPKIRFEELGYFAPMIFEKLRQDFLDIYPNENFIRNSYIKYLKINKLNENQLSTVKLNNYTQKTIVTNDLLQNINQNILSKKKTTVLFFIMKQMFL
jgi:hypothetical protein